MNRSNPWDVSASGPPVASGQVPFYNPAQFQQDHSTGSAMAPSGTFGDAGHGAGIDDMSANYPYEQAWHNNWNNFGAWPHAQGYDSAGYDGNYYLQQQLAGEPAASVSEGGAVGTYGELVYDSNWSSNQQFEHYPTQFAETGEYNYDPTMVGRYDNLAGGAVDSSSVSTSQSAMPLYGSHTFEDSAGMSPFFHSGDEVSSSGLPPQLAPPNMAVEGVALFSSDQLPTVNSFSNVGHQPSPFDELGDMKSPRIGMPEQSVLPSSHSRQSSAGGGVQFLIGGSSSVSESQSRADSPRAPGVEAACGSAAFEQDEADSRTVVTEHVGVTQPHFTDAGSHKNLTGRMDDSPVHSLLPQGTMTGTPASGHHRKLAPAAGPAASLEHPHMPPDLMEPMSSESDATQMLQCLANAEFVHPEASICEKFGSPQQVSHQVDDSQMLIKTDESSEHKTDMYAGPLGSHPDSSFTPVGNALVFTSGGNTSATNAAMSPGQQFTNSRSAAEPHMQTGSVCSAAASDGGALDMREIELDAMVDSGSPQDAVRRIEADSNVEAVSECRVGSGTFKQSLHDARSLVHHHVKAHREAAMSPATTLWENPEPAGVRLLPASAAVTESRSTTDRVLTYELPQNTDAGPSKSGASATVHEPSLEVRSAMYSADDQRVPQTPLTNSALSQPSHVSCIDHSVPSQIVSESSSRTVEHQSVVQPTTGPDTSSILENEAIDSLSEELARSNISSVNHYSQTLKSVHAKPSHAAVRQTSGKLTSEGVITVPGGNIVTGVDVIQGPQSSELRPSMSGEVEHTRRMVAHQTPSATRQNVEHGAGQNQRGDDKNSQANVHVLQNKDVNIHQAVLHGEKMENGDVVASSQQKARREFDNTVPAMKPKQQPVPHSVSDVPDARYQVEVDRSRPRQGDVDQVNRRPLSRQGYDDRDYGRPRSRQDYNDRDHDRPPSRHGYGYEQPKSRQVSEDPYSRPRSSQGYEDPYYNRPRSRQGYGDRHDMPSGGQSYIYPEGGHQQRPSYEGRRDRPSSRQSYHEPEDRPRSRQEYDYRPRSRQDYEDWSARGSRDHGTARHRDNRYSDADSYKRPGSNQEFFDEHRDLRQTSRQPDESFNRPRYDAPDEGYDRTSRRSRQDDSGDPRYRPGQGYREEEYRRPRSRGAEYSDKRQARYDDRRRGDRSREHSRERYCDPYEYMDYYRAAYARDYEYYSHYGAEAYYAQYYAMHPYDRGYYEELRIPAAQDQGYSEGYEGRQEIASDRHSQRSVSSRGSTPLEELSSADQFARAFHKGSRPGSALSGNVPSPIGHMQEPQYGNYVDEQFREGPQVMPEEPSAPHRMTPHKFCIPHARASFGPTGRLLHVLPNSPLDGQPASLEIVDIGELMSQTHEADSLRQFPGPLVRVETHKNDVLLFCQSMSAACRRNSALIDSESAELLWHFLELLIKQNGTLMGTDIADLLLEGHEPESRAYARTSTPANQVVEGSANASITEDRLLATSAVDANSAELTDRFRHLLLHGRKKDALEWSVKKNLWGHALFLASKMDAKTHASILTRFANVSMKMNDPLQTLYQIMSGRQPAAATLAADEKWGDWRPHLSIMLSNPTARPELDRKSIITLGDTLASRGFLHGSQFCYLVVSMMMSREGGSCGLFGPFSNPSSKLVLIGASHSVSFEELFNNVLAVQCTELFEYGISLGNASFLLPTFHLFKYLYVLRLVDYGLLEEALRYAEVLGLSIATYPHLYPSAMARGLCELVGRLKYWDHQRLMTEEPVDAEWLQYLAGIIPAMEDGSIQQLGNVSSYAGSEAGDHMASAQGVVNYQLHTEQVSFMQMSQQPAAANVYASHQPVLAGQQSLSSSSIQPLLSVSSEANKSAGFVELQTSTGSDPTATGPSLQYSHYPQPTTYQHYAGDSRLAATSEAQSLPTIDAESTQMWNQYHIAQQHDATDGSQIGHPQLNAYQAVAEHGESDTLVQDSTSHTSNVHSFYVSQPVNNFDFSAPGLSTTGLPPTSQSSLSRQRTVSSSSSTHSQHTVGSRRRGSSPLSTPGSQENSSVPLGTAATEQQKKKPYWPGEESDDQSATAKTKTNKSVPSGKSKESRGWFPVPDFIHRWKNRPKEMILPDDKNPSIVWDPVKNRYVNKDEEDEGDAGNGAKRDAPPPTDAEFRQKMLPTMPSAALAPTQNRGMFNRAKTRGARGQYVDVLGGANKPLPAAPGNLFTVLPKSASMPANIFVPNALAANSESAEPASHSSVQQDTLPAEQSNVPQVRENNAVSSRYQAEQAPHQQPVAESEPPPATPAAELPAQSVPGLPLMFNPSQFSQPPVLQQPATSSGLHYGQRRQYPRK